MKIRKLTFLAPTFILTALLFVGVLATLSNKAYAQAHKLEVATGKVERLGQNGQWVIVKQGTTLVNGDLLRLGRGVRAKVRCSNGTTSFVPRKGGTIGAEVCVKNFVDSSNNAAPNAPASLDERQQSVGENTGSGNSGRTGPPKN